MRLRTQVLLVLAALIVPAARAADDSAYRTPPSAVADLLTAPRVPRGAPNSSPDGAWLAVPDLRSLLPIETLAEPVVKLAGLEVLPGMWANRTGLKNAAAGLTFYKVADGTQVRAKLPADYRVQYLDREPGKLARLLSMFGVSADGVVADLITTVAPSLAALDASTALLPGVPAAVVQGVRHELGWLAEVAERRKPFEAVVHCLCSAP